MPTDFRIGVLAAGAVLLVAAILSGRIFETATRTAVARLARLAIGVIGITLTVWVLASYLGVHAHPVSVPAAASPPPVPASPVDLIDRASSALQDCVLANAPPVPDGSTASLTQMAAARSAFQAYDAATNSYVRCVDSTVEHIAKQFEGVASEADLQSLKTFGVSMHNTAVDQEQALADKFNSQIRTYKAKHVSQTSSGAPSQTRQ
jgi:hypothetical protein